MLSYLSMYPNIFYKFYYDSYYCLHWTKYLHERNTHLCGTIRQNLIQIYTAIYRVPPSIILASPYNPLISEGRLHFNSIILFSLLLQMRFLVLYFNFFVFHYNCFFVFHFKVETGKRFWEKLLEPLSNLTKPGLQEPLLAKLGLLLTNLGLQLKHIGNLSKLEPLGLQVMRRVQKPHRSHWWYQLYPMPWWSISE